MNILKGLLNDIDVDYTETTFDTLLGPATLGADLFVTSSESEVIRHLSFSEAVIYLIS